MTSRDEALRALEKKWRKAGDVLETTEYPADADLLRQCADELAALLTTRQEVAPVAPLGFVLRDKDGGDWWPETFCIGEPEDDETDDAEWTPVYTSTGQTSDARDGNAERYKWLRSALYSDAVAVGEASIRLDVVGACPTLAAFDEAIDAAMKEAGNG